MQRRTHLWAVAVVAAAVAAMLVVTAVWILPAARFSGGGENAGSPGVGSVNSRSYSSETHELFGSNVPSWDNFSFDGVSFGIHFWCGTPTPAAGQLCGSATEANGLEFSYSFGDGPPQQSPQWQTALSPDGSAGTQYMLGGHLRLLVAVTLPPPS